MQNKLLLIVVIVAVVLGSSMLTRGHEWGDDFASYLMQAESILAGRTEEFVEHNAFTIFESSNQIGPVAYPWGYPLILTPAYAFKGNHPLTLKVPGLFFYAVFLVCLYLLMKTRFTSTESLLIVSLFAFNPLLLRFLDQIASDIPFLFFSTLALWLMLSNGQNQLAKHIALGFAVAGAFFIRTTGIVLLGSFLVMQLIHLWTRKSNRASLIQLLKNSIVVVVTFGLLWLLYTALFPGGGESYFAQYQDFKLETALAHASNYFQVFSQFFGDSVIWKMIYFIFVIFFLIGAWNRRKEDLLFIIFFVLWMFVLITWPSWQGARFIFPLLPIFIYFTFAGMKSVREKLPEKYSQAGHWVFYGVWSLIGISFLYTASLIAYGNLQSDRAINGPYDPFSKEVYTYIQEESPADSVVIFFKPRAMRLMTDRDSILSTECDRILKGDYLVLSTKVGNNQQIPPEEIDTCNLPLNQVLENNRFVVYEIRN